MMARFLSPVPVSDNFSVCWCGGSGPEPAGTGGVPGVPVLLPQGHR